MAFLIALFLRTQLDLSVVFKMRYEGALRRFILYLQAMFLAILASTESCLFRTKLPQNTTVFVINMKVQTLSKKSLQYFACLLQVCHNKRPSRKEPPIHLQGATAGEEQGNLLHGGADVRRKICQISQGCHQIILIGTSRARCRGGP